MAAKRRNIYQDAKDILQQGLISVRKLSSFFKQTSHDKRTVKSTQRAAAELSEGRKPKEVASQLGMSYQRWTAIKKQIDKGQAYSPELRDILKDTREEYLSEPQKETAPGGKSVWYFPDMNRLKQRTKVDLIKPFGFLSDALAFWETIISSSEYIAITNKDGMYYVVGLGKRSQRPQKGKKMERGGGNRVNQLLKAYPR